MMERTVKTKVRMPLADSMEAFLIQGRMRRLTKNANDIPTMIFTAVSMADCLRVCMDEFSNGGAFGCQQPKAFLGNVHVLLLGPFLGPELAIVYPAPNGPGHVELGLGGHGQQKPGLLLGDAK